MSDLSITASAVRGSVQETAQASIALTAGKLVCKDTNGKWALADCNNTAVAVPVGITLQASDADQPLSVVKDANVTVNAVLTAGTFYYLSATAGAICPFADLSSGCRVVQLGYAISTTVLRLSIVDTGIVL